MCVKICAQRGVHREGRVAGGAGGAGGSDGALGCQGSFAGSRCLEVAKADRRRGPGAEVVQEIVTGFRTQRATGARS